MSRHTFTMYLREFFFKEQWCFYVAQRALNTNIQINEAMKPVVSVVNVEFAREMLLIVLCQMVIN